MYPLNGGAYLIKGLCNHGDLVTLVGRFSKALEGGGLDHSLTKGDDRVCDLHFYLSIQLSQVLHTLIRLGDLIQDSYDIGLLLQFLHESDSCKDLETMMSLCLMM